ncbi:glycosyltransferase family 2 protein, partial [Aquimarina celericrescens]|nr:glycosyltransferase family 2 protein [Aquimarina celericrescens]
IQEHKLRFNVDFGLGAKFVCAEEQLLRHEVISRGLKVVFVGTPILIHKGKTSASDMGRPNLIRATTAYKYLVYKNWA